MKRLLLTATITLAFSAVACTSSSVHNGIEGSAMRLSLDVCQSDFLTDSTETETESDSTQSENNPQTRATEIAFQKDDNIGLFVHSAASVASSGNHSSNVKYVATDASSWQAANGLGGELVTGTAYKVTAYYPYKANAANATSIDHSVATDQSSAFNAAKAGALELSDFMIADPTSITGNFATTPAAALTFSHKLAKLVVSVGVPSTIESVDVTSVQSVTILNLKTRCTINIATGAISTPTEVQDIAPRLVEGTGAAGKISKWEAIVVPQTVAAGTLMVRIVCLMKDANIKELTYTVPASAPLTIVQGKKLTLTLSSSADLAITKGLELVDGIAKSALELGVKATSGVQWTLTSPAAWVTLSTNKATYTSSISGTGTGSEQVVYVTVGANSSFVLPRSATLTLSDAGGSTTTHEVVQNYFSLQAVDATITGGAQSVSVAAFASNQIWSATSTAAWLKLSATSAGASSSTYGPHTGSLAANTLYYQAELNVTSSSRTATVNYASVLAGSSAKGIVVTQAASSTSYNSPSSTTPVAKTATSVTFTVTGTSGLTATLARTAGSTAFSAPSPASITCNGSAQTITVTMAANTSTARDATYSMTVTNTGASGLNLSGIVVKQEKAEANIGDITTGSDGTGLPAGMMCVGRFGGWNGSAYTKDLYIDKRGTATSGVNQGNVDDGTKTWDYYGSTAPQGVNPTYNGLGNTAVLTSSNANNYCRSKGMYLPAIRQLKDGMYAAQVAGKLTSEYSFVGNYYWSSTETSANNARVVYFGNGNEASSNKNSSNYVRCVREEDWYPTPLSQSNTYVATLDNTVANWQTATNNCAAWGGRLPTKDELLAIYNNKASYGTFVLNVWYWSSTPGDIGNYGVVGFNAGDVGGLNPDNDVYVRCVKTM